MNRFISTCAVCLTLLPFRCFADPFLKMDTLLTYPAVIHNQFGKKVDRVFFVDFNGDEKRDYIIELKTNHPDKYHEVWITDKFEPYLQKVNDRLEFDYRFFINLDDDPEAELITARGTNKGINYVLLDYSGRKEEIVCYFNPVIAEKGKFSFGYPWDITGLDTKKVKKEICLQWNIVHDVKREGEYYKPEAPRPFPLLFLEGKTNSIPIRDNEMGKQEWFSLNEIKNMRIKVSLNK